MSPSRRATKAAAKRTELAADPRALILDSDGDHMLRVAEVFRREGFSVHTAGNVTSAREELLRHMPEIALIDLDMGQEGLALIEGTDLSEVIEIYLMTADPGLETAVRGLRAGASEYLRKPVNLEQLRRALETYCRGSRQREDEDADVSRSGRGLLQGESPPMKRLYRLLRKVAPSDATVFIVGESGVGKELAAQTIHELSGRSREEFVPVNCGAIASELMESELFGHERGAFTGAHRRHRGFFERAHCGTLLLDEITEMAPELQVRLLRVLESRRFTRVGGETDIEIDVRVIASTNRDPVEAVSEGLLREDLYYRLAEFPLRVPSLRERGDDIIILAEYFLAQCNKASGIEKRLSDEVIEILRLHDWPGNVRELKNAISRAHIIAGEEIQPDDLPGTVLSGDSTSGDYLRVSIGLSVAEVERRTILATLEHFEGDKKRAAEVLGISLKTLYTKLKKYREKASRTG